MSYLIPSFLAGVLTVLAPCVFTLLPVILSGSVGEKTLKKPLIIIASLSVSVLLFSLILKGSTTLISIPQIFWLSVSGGILILFGITMLFPDLWNNINVKLKLYKSEELLNKNVGTESLKSNILLGASLGPVFTTCSPTYALILAIILPANLALGFINLVAYTLGLALILFLIALGGQKVVKNLKFAVNPNGWFKKTLGALIILTGLAILTGYDKKIESAILDTGYLGPIAIEQKIKDYFTDDES